MSTPRPSMKLLVESGIVPRAPNQRPLTWNSLGPKLSWNFSLRKGMHFSYENRVVEENDKPVGKALPAVEDASSPKSEEIDPSLAEAVGRLERWSASVLGGGGSGRGWRRGQVRGWLGIAKTNQRSDKDAHSRQELWEAVPPKFSRTPEGHRPYSRGSTLETVYPGVGRAKAVNLQETPQSSTLHPPSHPPPPTPVDRMSARSAGTRLPTQGSTQDLT
ncbi:unnamed protein product [Nezara viridula]|uniref:Uncharacterized protein n=1 Tax=Nezara viridula TaxID=85310 RepID=A0A9P0MVL9_NEZVI|nr:unnamed protein product [Nezara viridula]